MQLLHCEFVEGWPLCPVLEIYLKEKGTTGLSGSAASFLATVGSATLDLWEDALEMPGEWQAKLFTPEQIDLGVDFCRQYILHQLDAGHSSEDWCPENIKGHFIAYLDDRHSFPPYLDKIIIETILLTDPKYKTLKNELDLAQAKYLHALADYRERETEKEIKLRSESHEDDND